MFTFVHSSGMFLSRSNLQEDLDLCKKDLLQVRKFLANGIYARWIGTFTYPYLGIIGLEVLRAYIAHVTF